MYKATDKWLPGYLRSMAQRPAPREGTRHLVFCLADHFEPLRGGVAPDAVRATVRAWAESYRELAGEFRDADGRPPRHTFFYPAEEFDPDCLRPLAELTAEGLAEVEVHLHHRQDTPDGLRAKLIQFRDRLRGQGLLGSDAAGAVRYGFVHGNWALCNSRPDGDWCGVDAELKILSETGCYADFTFPSAPSPTQPRMVNAIYYAHDLPGRARGADRGELVSAEEPSEGGKDGHDAKRHGWHTHSPDTALMIIQGPLALNWRRRKWGVLPRMENAEISAASPSTPDRIELWARQGIHVRGCPEWVFVKVHTHGYLLANRAAVLGESMRATHAFLQARFNDGARWKLHYVAAREMYNLVRAAERGQRGDPHPWRDGEIQPPTLYKNMGR